jgi:hypothetical protein
LKLSLQINVLKSSQVISCVSVEVKTNTSEVSSISIIRFDVVNDHISLIYIVTLWLKAGIDEQKPGSRHNATAQ